MPDFEDFDMTAMEEAMNNGETVVEETPSFENTVAESTNYTPPAEEVADNDIVTPPTGETVVTEPVTAPVEEVKPVEIIKEVERIVEKAPEFKNEKSKLLFESLTNAEDPKAAEKSVLDYLREKNRDYSVMSDMDVVKAALRKENPTWTKDDVDLKIRRTYGKNLTTIDLNTIDRDIEPEKYAQAEIHNEDVSNALADLRLDALQKRPALMQQQEELELPNIKPVQQSAPTGPTPEQIEAANKAWKEAVDASMGAFSSIKQTIDDKEVEYSLTEDEKKTLNTKIENFNLMQFSKDRGWQNADGTPNIQKLAEDVLKLENFDKISKSFGTQLKTEVTKDVLKSIKNVNDTKRPSQENGAPASLADAFYAAIDGAK